MGRDAKSRCHFRKGQAFEKEWKSHEIVARLVRGQYADPELTKKVKIITADTFSHLLYSGEPVLSGVQGSSTP